MMSALSVFELFKVGIGPSSSHTVGPMRAAKMFAHSLKDGGFFANTANVRAELYGSLGATGKGHGSDKAVLMGLEGESPDQIDPAVIPMRLEKIRTEKSLMLLGEKPIGFDEKRDLLMLRKALPNHPNGMIFAASDSNGAILRRAAYYSVGGGFVSDEAAFEAANDSQPASQNAEPFSFSSAAELLSHCDAEGMSISGIVLANEKSRLDESEIRRRLSDIWRVMQECVKRGCESDDEFLPGILKVKRRARGLYEKLTARQKAGDPLVEMDWAGLYAIAVNEENAAGGRVVTAPTNGAAGIVPAVLHYYVNFRAQKGEDAESAAANFLLASSAVGMLCKQNASISGAEVGCQGEVGSACSMAAAALTEAMGGTPHQAENAAEIAMEHHLGLTCDPIAGLVQIPCIERNAMGAAKAITAARMALAGDGGHFVSLDRVIKTMWETGQDMKIKYKETSRGGLAVHAVEVPVNFVDC